MNRKYLVYIAIFLVLISLFITWKTKDTEILKNRKTEDPFADKNSSITEIPQPSVKAANLVCKSEIADIIKEYNLYWGDNFAENSDLKFGTTIYANNQFNASMKSMISKYFSCISIAEGSNRCEKIPEGKDFSYDKNECKEKVSLYEFIKYASGKESNIKKCLEFTQKQFEIAETETSNIDHLLFKLFSPKNRNEFCNKTKKIGIEKICDEFSVLIGEELAPTCKSFFPENLEKALSNPKSKEYFSTYMALKENKDFYCETGEKSLCLAALKSDGSHCEDIKKKITSSYCEYIANLSQKIEEAKKEKEEKKKKEEEEFLNFKLKQEEARKKEQEEAERKKQEQELIKKAKELLNKKTGGEDE
ncbi:MAG: hypothetical protein N2Z60_02915 [Elusimicrobiales bacterium]|nr:hypothetical protein [Elusimicrobiales bacterium]